MVFNMKNFILLLMFNCVLYVYSQGNLQFNRALFLPMEINYSGSSSPTPTLTNSLQIYLYDTVVLNVPTGKVVKVEHINYSVKKLYVVSCDYDVNNNPFFSSTLVDTLATGNGGIPTAYWVSKPSIFLNGIVVDSSSPIWLNAGTYVFTLKGSSQEIDPNSYCSGANYFRAPVSYKGFISAIEFNIIP